MLWAHIGATLAMTGIIWMVQVVQYPLFARVGEAGWAGYHQAHMQRITWVVAPLMAVELVTGGWLALMPPDGIARAWPLVGCGLLAVVWGSTALVQVPQHTRLGDGWDAALGARLVRGNWLRTGAWSARAALVLWMAAEVSG